MKQIKFIFPLLIALIMLSACKSGKIQEEPVKTNLEANKTGDGPAVYLDFKKGPSHNHPSFVLWAEDIEGNFIQTLFISQSVGTSIFEHGDATSGHWEPGIVRRPASLPYWSHRRAIKAADGLFVPSAENPVADAYTGATPPGNFVVQTRFDNDPPQKIRIYFEINQTWDWNEFWSNNKYPDNAEYKTSCQPALVYMCMVDLENPQDEYTLNVIGHSHYAGENGELFTDLSTMTTALKIVASLTLKIN